jgi:hypothetical protein
MTTSKGKDRGTNDTGRIGATIPSTDPGLKSKGPKRIIQMRLSQQRRRNTMDGGLNEPLNEILVLGRRGSGIDDNMELRQLSSQSGRCLDTASVSANGT